MNADTEMTRRGIEARARQSNDRRERITGWRGIQIMLTRDIDGINNDTLIGVWFNRCFGVDLAHGNRNCRATVDDRMFAEQDDFTGRRCFGQTLSLVVE